MSEIATSTRSEKNPRGIPHAPFVVGIVILQGYAGWHADGKCQDDVDKYMGGTEADVEPVLRSFQEAIAYVVAFALTQSPLTVCTRSKEVPIHGEQPLTKTRQSGREDP
jgi:uncharacterized OB-fold protein